MPREKCISQLPHVRVSDTLMSAVTLIAEREDRSVAWIVRTAIEEFVAQYTAANVHLDTDAGNQPYAAQCASPVRGMV